MIVHSTRTRALLAAGSVFPLAAALFLGMPRGLLVIGLLTLLAGVSALLLKRSVLCKLTGSLLAVAIPIILCRMLADAGLPLGPHVERIYASLAFAISMPLIWLPSGPMRNYMARRILLIVPTFLGISVITFLVVQLAPGSPIFLKLHGVETASGGNLTAEIIEQTKRIYGLDKPVPVRYALWLGKLLMFDFGDSYKDFRPVIVRISEALPVTLQLNLMSLFLIYVISVPLGIFSATHQYSYRDYAVTMFLFILFSLPSFWVAMLLMYFLCGGAHFDWFPVYGLSSPGADSLSWPRWLMDRAWHMVLPLFCLTYSGFAYLSRYARAGLIETIRQDYIRTARAYGFSEWTIIYKYALRNSLIPIITLFGTLLPSLISGSVIIESIFSVPGMGRLSFEAILSRDYPLIMGILSITAMLTLIGLLISDALYALVDPRIRFD